MFYFLFTPKMIIDAPLRVAVCPPLGQGETPSIRGVAHCHLLGSNSFASKLAPDLCNELDLFSS